MGGESSEAVPSPLDGSPLVTISLVTYNGRRWLAGCLASLRAQRMADFELLVIDNASTDGSAEWLRSETARDDRRRVEIKDSSVNLGYAAAHNRNIAAARGEFVLLLNQDVELDEGFLEHAVALFDGRPRIAAVQALVLHLAKPGIRTDEIDTTGLLMQRDRRVLSRAQGEARFNAPAVAGPVWGADGPVPLYRRAALLACREPRTGGGWETLDEDFFLYKEDVDLAWRMRLLGWQAWYEPAALAWHARGAGGPPAVGWRGIIARNRASTPTVRALSWRNQRLMQLKCDTAGGLMRDLPWVLGRELLSAGYVALADPLRLRAVPELMRLAPSALRKRRHIWRLVRSQRALASHDRLPL
jgi:GT2 family glycosyltransferase